MVRLCILRVHDLEQESECHRYLVVPRSLAGVQGLMSTLWLCGAQVIAVRVAMLGYWPVLVMYAVRTGFAGALSTVSTYVAEVSAG